MSVSDVRKLPEVMAFAGPNGSGKTTITRMAKIVGEYINADDIKKGFFCISFEIWKWSFFDGATIPISD